MSPIRTLVALPVDCYDLAGFEWSEVPASLAATPVALPAQVQFKSLADSFGELVAAVRSHKRPTNPLTTALFSK
jgi:hypothetical protein